MGKKKIKKQTEEELLKESEKIKPEGKISSFSDQESHISDSENSAATVTKPSKQITKGKIYIEASYNNTAITVTDEKGGVLAWSSAGALGFNGPKKATPYAAAKVAEALLEKIRKVGFLEINIFVKGIGSGRESAIRSFASHGLNIVSIKDITPVPHNGPRPKKVRRV